MPRNVAWTCLIKTSQNPPASCEVFITYMKHSSAVDSVQWQQTTEITHWSDKCSFKDNSHYFFPVFYPFLWFQSVVHSSSWTSFHPGYGNGKVNNNFYKVEFREFYFKTRTFILFFSTSTFKLVHSCILLI